MLTYDLSRDVGMINAKIMKGVVKDYINLTKDEKSVRMDVAVDVEGGLTIVCSIFNIFDTEEQAKRVADILTKMGKEIFTYKEEMPLRVKHLSKLFNSNMLTGKPLLSVSHANLMIKSHGFVRSQFYH